jgi:hypothetical protein
MSKGRRSRKDVMSSRKISGIYHARQEYRAQGEKATNIERSCDDWTDVLKELQGRLQTSSNAIQKQSLIIAPM